MASVLEAPQRPTEPWATTTLRASERIRPASINYDYAGQDPINNYDLSGECVFCSNPLGIVSTGERVVHTGKHAFTVIGKRVGKVRWDFVLLAGADVIESSSAFALSITIVGGCAAAGAFSGGIALAGAPFCITSAAAAAAGGAILAHAAVDDFKKALEGMRHRRRRR